MRKIDSRCGNLLQPFASHIIVQNGNPPRRFGSRAISAVQNVEYPSNSITESNLCGPNIRVNSRCKRSSINFHLRIIRQSAVFI